MSGRAVYQSLIIGLGKAKYYRGVRADTTHGYARPVHSYAKMADTRSGRAEVRSGLQPWRLLAYGHDQGRREIRRERHRARRKSS